MSGEPVLDRVGMTWAVVIAAGAFLLLTGAPPAGAQAAAPDCPPGWVCPGVAEEAPAADCPPGWACPQEPQDEPSSGMSEGEAQLRLELMQRSMGFGGIFGPALQDWLNSPSAPDNGCGGYTDYAARQACGNGDLWAADRLQQDRSTPAERDWYSR